MDPLCPLCPNSGGVAAPGMGFPGAFGPSPMFSGNGALNRVDPLTGGLTPMPTMTGASADPMVSMLMMQSQMLSTMMNLLLKLMMAQPRNGQQGGGGTQNASMISDGGSGGGGGGASAMGGSSATNSSGGSSGPASPGTQALLQRAGGMVGMTETGNRDQIKQITGKSGIDPATTPWCAAFAINLMKEHGTLDTTGLKNPNYCPEIMSWAKEKGIFQPRGSTPKAGDAILFDWQGDGTSDHIGIVEKVEGGKITTIEGNSSDSVKRNTYEVGSAKIAGYVQSK